MASRSEKQRRKVLFADVTKQRQEAEAARQQAELTHLKILRDQAIAHEASLMSSKDALLYGKIDGILETYSSFVEAADADHAFFFKVVSKPASLGEALKTYYKLWGQEGAPYSLTELNNPKEDLQEPLERWLFSYVAYHSQQCDYTMQLPEWRHSYIAQVIETMFQVAKPIHVWKVDLRPIRWYACDWDEFVLESHELIFVLHLSVSD